MKKLLLIIVPILLAIAVFFLVTMLLSPSGGKGALQVTSDPPKSKVYLNGKEIGLTPLCKCDVTNMLDSGEYTIRIVPNDQNLIPFEEKIVVTKSVLTVVDRLFTPGAGSEGSVITLRPTEDKTARDIFVISRPEGAEVTLDNNAVGTTPVLLTKVTESDHEIKLKKSGYKEKTIRIRAVKGYKLEALVMLGVGDLTSNPTPTAQPSPTASPSATPTVASVTILQTPTGFLRVRSSASTRASEIGRVNPGESYELMEEKEGWYGIKLPSGQTGWISSQYAEKK